MISLTRLLCAAVLACAVCGVSVRAEEKKEDPKKEAPKDPPKEAPKKDPKDMNADEAEAGGLCPVKKGASKLIYHTVVNGKEYHFCSRECMKNFAADPSKFGVKKDEKK